MNHKNSVPRIKDMPWGNNNGKTSKERIDPALVSDSYGVYMHLNRYNYASNFFYGKVLDLGCGTGYGTRILSINNNVTHVIGIDISKEAINYAKKYYLNKKIQYQLSKAENLPFIDNYFDCLAAYEVIEHVNDYKKTLKEINRVLKHDGQLLISSPNPRDLLNRIKYRFLKIPYPKKHQENPHHIKEFYYEELMDLLRKYNFRIINSFGQTIRFPFLDKLIHSKNKLFYKTAVDIGRFFPKFSLYYIFMCSKNKYSKKYKNISRDA